MIYGGLMRIAIERFLTHSYAAGSGVPYLVLLSSAARNAASRRIVAENKQVSCSAAIS